MPIDKIDKIYDAMVADGAAMPERDKFKKKMLASGAEGYKNRKAFYDAMVADGADMGGSYEAFADKIGLHAINKPKPIIEVGGLTPFSEEPTDKDIDTVTQVQDEQEKQRARYSIPIREVPEDFKVEGDFVSNPINVNGKQRTMGDVANDLYREYDNTYRKARTYETNGYGAAMNKAKGEFRLDEDTARQLVGGVHDLYMKNVASDIAEELYRRMDKGGDPLYKAQKALYDKDFLNSVYDHAASLGYDNAAPFIEQALKPAFVRMMQKKFNGLKVNPDVLATTMDGIKSKVQHFDAERTQEEELNNRLNEMDKFTDQASKELLYKEDQLTKQEIAERQNQPFLIRMLQAFATGEGMDVSSPTIAGKRSALHDESSKLRAMRYAIKDARNTQKAANMFKRGNSFLSQIGKGALDRFTDVRAWDFGLTDMGNSMATLAAVKNYEEGKASSTDEKLLEAIAIGNSLRSRNQDAMSNHDVGSGAVDSAFYGLTFIATPYNGLGGKLAQQFEKYAFKRFGAEAIKSGVLGKMALAIGKKSSRMAGDLVFRPMITTAMYGSAHIAADASSRQAGIIGFNDNGSVEINGKESNALTALAKATGALYIENMSEGVSDFIPGSRIIGKSIQKGIGKTFGKKAYKTLQNWGEAFTDAWTKVGTNEISTVLEQARKRAKLGDLTGEYIEEIVGGIGNALVIGDQTLDTQEGTGVFNTDNMWQTLKAISVPVGTMNAVQYGAHKVFDVPNHFGEAARYEAKNNMLRSQIRAKAIVGDKWEDVKNLVDGTDGTEDNEFGGKMSELTKNMNTEAKKAIVDYVVSRGYYNGANVQSVKEDIEGLSGEIAQAYKDGTSLVDKTEMCRAKIMYDESEKRLHDILGVKYSEELPSDEELKGMLSDTDDNTEIADRIQSYEYAKAQYYGMIERIQTNLDMIEEKATAEAEAKAHKQTNQIIPATMKLNDRSVYIVDGDIVKNDDGTINKEKSSDSIMIKDAESGKAEMVSPSAILSVEQPVELQQVIDDAVSEQKQAYAAQEADKIDGKLDFMPNDQFYLFDNDKQQHEVLVVDRVMDEETQQIVEDKVIVSIDGARPTIMSKEELQDMHLADVANDVNNSLSEANEQVDTDADTADTTTEEPIEDVNTATTETDTTTEEPTEATEEEQTIPTDENRQPIYEQAEPTTAWNAIVEQCDGDVEIAQTVANDMVADMEAALKKAEKAKPKGGATVAEKIASEKERKAVIEQAKANLEHWKKIANVNFDKTTKEKIEQEQIAAQEAAARKAEQEARKAEQEEAERQKREALNGVPNVTEDTASDARARGYRRVDGDKVDRQEPINAKMGKEVNVKFDDDNIPTGHIAIIEADELQPSHNNGRRNPLHFIDEAQPKERIDDASKGAARKIASKIRPEEITTSITAYTGAPTVNSRGEVIQGNNRSAALKEMWSGYQEQADKYKQYLIEHADELGLSVDDIKAVKHPVLVNMLNVTDDEAIKLGQFVASDTESGGTERIKPKNVVKKLGEKMRNFANILLDTTDEDMTFAELIDKNGLKLLQWLSVKGIITPTQYKSAFDTKGNLTAEAKNDIKGTMYQSIFEGGSTQLEEMFATLPAKAQKAILATAYRDFDSPSENRMIEDIQESIMAFYALSHDEVFMAAKNHEDARMAVEAWKRQYAFDDATGESYLPSERFSNFALLLAVMYKGDNQRYIQSKLINIYDLIQGTQPATLFGEPDNTPRTLEQTIRETLNIEYDGKKRSNVLVGNNTTSQRGRQGSNRDATARGQSEEEDGAKDHQGGIDRDSIEGVSSKPLSAEQANVVITSMEDNAVEDPQISLTPETWIKVFGINNSIETPIGNVKMGENQFAKLQDKKRTSEFGMISLTLSDPDVIFIEPSEAKEDKEAERNFSYVFAKTYKRNGEKIKHYASVTVSIDGLEISVSSHFVNPNKIRNKLVSFERAYTKKALFSNSSEWHLAEHQKDVPDLLPTQKNNASVGKDTQSSETKQEKEEKVSPTERKDGEDLFAHAERVAKEVQERRKRKAEEEKVDTNPTEAQKEAGNYKKGHIKVDGMDITIEQPKGSVRRGRDADGKEWESKMHNTYGYIRGTESVDGDHIDIFLSDNPNEGSVFVVDQVNNDGSFDEHKVMYGFADMESAKQAYLSNYKEGWQGLGNITEVSKEDFRKWIDSSKRKTKPFAEYSAYAKETPKAKDKPKDSNSLVSDERMEELKRRLREKLRGQLNMGVDPELLAIGTEIAVGYIERGVTKFGEYAKAMIADLGDTIRPYLKALYNGARDMPEMVELSKDMTPYNEVSSFNVATIGKEGEDANPSILDTAEQISNEATVESNVQQEAKNMVETEDVDNDTYSITKQHNNKKDIDIWVVRGKERTDKDVYMQRKQVAKEHNGYYSSFRGVNGFVFNSPEDAQAFADKVFNTENNGNYAQKSEEIMRTDNQGNPIDEYGNLIVEKIASISDLTDEDFEHPTRSVELPAIPQNVDDAIGANGKPVVIKKNIFEKNKQSHSDLTPVQSREILHSALYNADLYGRNQKAKRPYNWVVINTTDEKGHNRLVLLEVNNNKDNVEIVHWHYIDERGFGKIKKQAEREGGQLLILPSDISEEAGALSSRTPDLSSAGKDTQSSDKKQEKEEENAITEREGLKIGDKVMYKGKEATIYAIEEDRPLLDTGLAPVMYELGRWEDVTPIKEKPLETKDKGFKEVDTMRVMESLNKNGEAKLSDHIAEKEQENVGANKKVVSSHTEGSLFDSPTTESLTKKEGNESDPTLQDNDRSRESHTGIRVRQEELSTSDNVGGRTSVQDTQGDSQGERLRPDNGSSEFGARPKYDVNKKYSNKEIQEIVSSVTEIKDGKVVITDDVTEDIRAIARMYVSGGIAKEGRGVLDEYYTDGKIVDAIGSLIAPLLPKGKRLRVLEPSVGMGNFLSAIPTERTSKVVTFEINETTARIAKILHPDIDVNVRSFETEFIDDFGNKKSILQKYDVVVGNPPYGAHRGVYKGLGEESKISRYEDYFVKRSLDVLNDGGVLAMVLPSSWLDRQNVANGYEVIRAYRLPSGAFAGTKVGTDIVVIRKTNKPTQSNPSKYFEAHPDRIMGTEKERTGRFGRTEKYIDGDVDAALDAIRRDEAIDIAIELNLPTDNDTLNSIRSAIEEAGSNSGAKKIVEEEKKEVSKRKASTPTKSNSNIKRHLKKDGAVVAASVHFDNDFSESEIAAFKDTNYDGSIENWQDHKEHVSYHNGIYMNDFYYAEGDIYSRLSQLAIDKNYIIKNHGQEQYDKQYNALLKVLPKKKTIDEITITPNTTFAKNIGIGEDNLINMFVSFLNELPSSAFGRSSAWEVRGYIRNEQVYGKDKEYNQLVRERRKKVGDTLFKKFIKEELSESQRGVLLNAFNREYNGTYRPDYSKVPMFSKVRKVFKDKVLKLTKVQLAGVGRSTVKGVGVLAHEVGFGKTLSGVMAMHEAMTRGNAKKPLIVVPNDNIMQQWIETIEEALPEATVNVLGNLGTKYDLTEFSVNDGEFSIVTYEGLKSMSFSDDTYTTLANEFSYITDELKSHKSVRDAEKAKAKREELKGKIRKGTKKSYNFENFGFDYLTFDEVHNANHIVGKVKIDSKEYSDFRSQSQRTSELGIKTWLAAQYIQKMNNGRNVLLLSATPFTNKPLEYYSILSLVANNTLKKKGFYNVNEFFKTFMEADNELEINASGKPQRKTNVRRFRNNGLFQDLLSEYIDIKGEEDNPDLIRPDRHNKEYKLQQNDMTLTAMEEVQQMLNDPDELLKGIGYARQVAFTPYAIGGMTSDYKAFVENSPKIDATIKLITQNKKDNPDTGQIIYSEVCVDTFPMIREYLIKESGYKENEVRIITGATSNSERVKIQEEFNAGKIKIVIGSPAIKEGLNLQGNTTDMYILSLPWNFTQLRQIEGRGWRQGNKWKNIRINYMLTEDSVDVFMLQRLQVKQGLYNQAMKNGAESVDVSDIDSSELKAELIKSPITRAEIKMEEEEAKLRNEMSRLESEAAFIARKTKKYFELKESVKSLKERVKDQMWNGSYLREHLGKLEADMKKERAMLVERGIGVDNLDEKLQAIDNQIDKIKQQQSNEVKEAQLSKLVEQYTREREAQLATDAHSVDDYINERAKENAKGFFGKRKDKEEKADSSTNVDNEMDKDITAYSNLSDAEKDSEELMRDGDGAYSDDELSIINDPVAKILGRSTRSKRQREEFAKRERRNMAERVSELAKTLNLDNVEVITDTSGLQGRKAEAKGFYSKSNGKITVVVPNHIDIEDVEKTLLHEAVAHYGLRKLFGEHFDTFLDNVYQHAEEEIRKEIVKLAANNGWDFRTATEEYLAGLAENTNFENADYSFFTKIKELFLKMLNGIGFKNWRSVELSDNELRYLLWRSYENLKEPGHYRSILGEAADVAKQYELGVGNYAESESASERAAETSYGIEEVNRKFNEDLQKLNEDNADKVILWLGSPSNILLAAGVEHKPMKLYGNKVIKKMKKHGFALEELQDLPNAVANPIAVFDNYGREGNRTILTELRSQERNIMVAVTLGKNSVDVDFNIVSSVFGKGASNIVDWINNGYLTYVNKEKALNYLHFSERNISEASNNKELSSAAKIVKDFENPKIVGEKSVLHSNIDRGDIATSQRMVNEQFNRELQRYANGKMDKNEILHLGNPQGVMQMFLPDLPIVMRQRVIRKGSEKRHDVDVSAIMDMPNKLSAPIFVFQRSVNTIGVLTDMKDRNGKNVCVAIELERQIQNGAEYLEVNDVRSFHGREFKNIIEPIVNNHTLRWADKKKGLTYLSSASQQVQQEIDKQILMSAAKIVKDFDNPKVSDEYLFRDGDEVSARDIYEQRVSTSSYQAREALQDSMLGLKTAMDAVLKSEGVKKNIEDVEGWENAYLGENRLSSVSKDEADRFARELFAPMLEEVTKLCKDKSERAILNDYMMVKHGLERNELMAQREGEKNYQNYIRKEPNGTKTEEAFVEEARNRDYAGLTAVTDTDNVADATDAAKEMVDKYEQKNNTENLWKKVNAVTTATLAKSYECGIINKETFDKISGMYKYYIPLRGFDEKTSSDAYAYITHPDSAFNAPVKTANGRTSKADDPIANMQSMAESIIAQGNRNKLVKQKFLNFVLNHPSDLFSVNELWLEYNEDKEEWLPVFADNINDTDTPEEVNRKIEEFEEKMSKLAEKNPLKYKRGREAANIPYRVVNKKDEREHQIIVKRNGIDYVITVNGNPRAAQAVNGATNPDNNNAGLVGKFSQLGEKINRELSAFYTTRNPDFIISNFLRDMTYSNTMVWVKESPNYALRFNKNIAKCNPFEMKRLLARYRKGTLDMDDKTDNAFYHFMRNGGETGYANVRDIDKHKNDIRKELRRMNARFGIEKNVMLLAEQFDEVSRAIENSARFAAFLTSREFGRTIDRSIYDAKEISVNFNKKGAGSKFFGAKGQTRIGNIAAGISGAGRSLYVFWNAAIQGTTNFGRQAKRHPAKAFTMAATMFLLGATMASIGIANGDDDDDKNNYWNLPEYVRRSNITFKIGNQWTTIPLPVEYRALYGLGELMISSMSGKENFTTKELAKQIAGLASQVLPLDIMQDGGSLTALVPSAFKPMAEVGVNKSWTGAPIYKDTEYNKKDPEWTKAYKSANTAIVEATKFLNQETGGNTHKSGHIDFNPAVIEYLLNGYFSGVSNTVDRLSKMAEWAVGKREYSPRDFIFINRLSKKGDERTEARAVNNEYYRLKEEHDEVKKLLKAYEDDTYNGIFDYAEELHLLNNSEEFARSEIFDMYADEIKTLEKEYKEAETDEERKEIERVTIETKKMLIDDVNAIRK